MSLNKLIEEIKQVRPVANTEVHEDGFPQTLNARRGRQRQAAERLKTLSEEYTRELMRSAAFIVVTGAEENSQEFTKVAAEKFGCFTSEAESLYKELTDSIHPTLYEGKAASSSLFDVLGRVLEDKALKLGLIEYPQVVFKSEYIKLLNNRQDLQSLIRQAINEQVGAELVGINAVRSVAPAAIEKNHEARVTPIILQTDDPTLALSLPSALQRLSRNVYTVVVGKAPKSLKNAEGVLAVKEPTEELVQETLTKIKNSLK